LTDTPVATQRDDLDSTCPSDEPLIETLPTPTPPGLPSFWRRWLPDLIGAGAAVTVTMAALVVVMRLWEAHPHVPLEVGGDAYVTLILVKNLVAHGSYLTTPLMGAPYGQNWSDFPLFDSATFAQAKFFSFFTTDPALIVNLIFLTSFALVALTAYIACRGLRLSRAMGVVVAALYAFVPYHFFRGIFHLTLTQYWTLPLVCMLACRQLSPRPLVSYRAGERTWRRRLLTRGNVIGLVIMLLAGTTGIYYAVFAVLLVGTATVLRTLMNRTTWDLALGALLCLITLVVVGLQYLPTYLYQETHGPNPQAVVRDLGGVEVFSLKFSSLLLPTAGHRIPFLANLREESFRTPIVGENTETLGAVGAFGVLAMLAFVIWSVAGPRRRQVRPWTLLRATSVLTLVCVLVGIIGGVSSVIGAFGFTEIRAWNRISIVIAFLALVAVATLVDTFVQDRRWNRWRARTVLWVAAAAILTVGLLDQTTTRDVLDYDATARLWTGDAAFVHRIQNTVGSNGMIFQLPIAVFPEQGPLNGMYDYAESIGYLHSNTLRWSYGGMKGREATWQDRLRPLPAPELVRAIATAGFDGLVIDRSAYPDAGAAMIDQITTIVGAAPFASEVGEQVFFDLRAYRAQVERDLGPGLAAARAAVLQVPPVLPGDGFYQTEYPAGSAQTWSRSSSDLSVENHADIVRHYETTFAVTTAVAGQWQLRVTGDGVDEAVTISSQATRVTVDFDAPAGRSELHLSTNAPSDQGIDPRDLNFLVSELTTRVEG
jgi:hypothetical protein